jgi:ABC-type nitrate/sulfonate/bicarbonate transport system permease component
MSLKNIKSILLSFFSILIAFTFLGLLLSFNDSLPGLNKIIKSFFYNYNILLINIRISLVTLIPGLFFGIFFGIFWGLLTGYYKFFDFFLSPVLNFIRAIPPIALAPIFIIVIGIGYSSKVAIVSLGVFFPVWINTYQGIKNTSEKIKMFCNDFKLSPFKKFFKILLPNTTPYIVSGIRVSIAASLIMLFISEWIASTRGIGYFMSLAHTLNNLDDLLVGVLILGLISLLIDFVFINAIKLFFPWIKK